MKEIKPFLNEDFLLENEVAIELYHDYAQSMPIIDYHNHLSPAQIVEDVTFDNITQVWLAGDHYKWRAMRTLGIAEKYITGDASDAEKFQKWAEAVPFTIRNPLYHWTHLELQRYFDIDELLDGKSAAKIYDVTSHMLRSSSMSTQGLLRKQNVQIICTTDDPIDSLEYHIKAQKDHLDIAMYPAFRPDKAILIDDDHFLGYLEKLSDVSHVDINGLDGLIEALRARIDFFDAHGCRISDHGLEQIYAEDFTDEEADAILKKRMLKKPISKQESKVFMSAVLYHLGICYSEKNWVQQLHLGAIRNNSSRMKQKLGPDTGFDSIGDGSQAEQLARYLDMLDAEDHLAKTILYNLNPRDNEVMATMIGNFNDGSSRGKMQMGSAWWFLDQKSGMEKQIDALSNMGILSCFIGMLTDSRSFLSFPRHEYFRRILCNIIGRDVHNGELPHDTRWLGEIVQDICYHNAKQYFNF